MPRHLVHIGFPKTGSNFLRRWFDGHPQIAFADGGIAGFTNVYAIAKEGAAPRRDVRYRVTSCEGLATPTVHVGDPVETYDRRQWEHFAAAQSAVCDTLVSLFPNARVLVVTRGFRSSIISSYSQYVRTGGHSDFACFCDEIAATIAHDDNPWDYDHLVGRYVAAFGADDVIVLPYELLRDDADGFTRELERRLALDRFDGAGVAVNPSLSRPELVWYPRITRAVARLPIGSRARDRLHRAYVRGAADNRFRRLIGILQRFRPASDASFVVPDPLLEAFRGKADRLLTEPLFARYAADYLPSSRTLRSLPMSRSV